MNVSFSSRAERGSLSYAERNLRDDPLPNSKIRCGNVCQASWESSVQISEGADNQGPDNRGSTVPGSYSNWLTNVRLGFLCAPPH